MKTSLPRTAPPGPPPAGPSCCRHWHQEPGEAGWRDSRSKAHSGRHSSNLHKALGPGEPDRRRKGLSPGPGSECPVPAQFTS